MHRSTLDTQVDTKVEPSEVADASRGPLVANLGLVPLRAGTPIGRYVVRSRLGAGAMGVVVAAHDPQLDRKVAVKLLLPYGGEGREGRERLQREAQALAKLEHPNVVTVHDVGVHEGQVFVAMEFVEGQTLGSWMKSAGPEGVHPWRDVLRVFEGAGRGLAAAHAAGLVHRDFKPDNVMLGADGRARVMDFGLARTDGSETSERAARSAQEVEPVELLEHDALATPLTRTGVVMGTPAYMSPEQSMGQTVDALSDQFSYCVALYEALYGERPFRGQTLAELMASVLAGRVAEAPKDHGVPSWVRRLVVRGLAAHPEDRHPSMESLLRALRGEPATRRRRWLVGSGVAVAAAFGAWGAEQLAAEPSQRCEQMDAKLSGIWDDERREQVRAAIEGTELSYTAGTWRGVKEQLDRYTGAWVDARREACEATQRGEQSAELLDLRMQCLDRRAREVRALVDVLSEADDRMVSKAVTAAASLPALDRCADVQALQAEVPPPDDPDVAERVEALDERLAEASALERAGKFAEGLSVATAVVDEADGLGYRPLSARALRRQGSLQMAVGALEASERTLERAYTTALELKMTPVAADASADLVMLVGSRMLRPEDGLRWGRHAEPLAREVGTDDAMARVARNLGMAALAASDYDRARDHLERALTLRERSYGENHPLVAGVLVNLGNVTDSQQDFAQARVYYTRALEIFERTLGEHPNLAATLANLSVLARMERKLDEARELSIRALDITIRTQGPTHPSVGVVHNGLGDIASEDGKLAESRSHYEQAIAIWTEALGPEHPRLGYAINGLSTVARAEGKYDEALAHGQRVLALWEQAYGDEHRLVASVLNNLGNIGLARGDAQRAIGYFERTLAIYRSVMGPEHQLVGTALDNLGRASAMLERYDDARGYYEQALAIYETSVGVDDVLASHSLVGLGEVQLAEGDPAGALPYLERAHRIRTTGRVEATRVAQTAFALARALWDAPPSQGRDRPRARRLAEQAHRQYADASAQFVDLAVEVETWLGRHGS